ASRLAAPKSIALQERTNVLQDITRSCSRILTAYGLSSITCRGRGCWGSALHSCAGWVERLVRRGSTSEGGCNTHHTAAQWLMGFAALYPSYELPHEVSAPP